MEVRTRIRKAYQSNLNIELRQVIYRKINSLKNAGVEFESFSHAFLLGYLSGMENPKFEAVVESVRVMKLFSNLSEEGREIVMLIMDGMKARYKNGM